VKSTFALRAPADRQVVEVSATAVGSVAAAPAAVAHVPAFGRLWDFLALTKPRLNLLVLLTTLAGMYLAAPDGVAPLTLLHTLIGTALVAGGASAFNQVIERRTDALMRRTRLRPMADGRLPSAQALADAGVLSAAA
jgi:protoheme IX farnesyltransferase